MNESETRTEYIDPKLKVSSRNKKMGIRSFKISFQKKLIVTKLDLLSTETKKLEAICQQKLANLEELKKSFFKKAFNREL